jgi:hypothetical protein
MKIITLFVASSLALTGCTTINASLTPGATVSSDQFDGSKDVLQPPVSAASSLTEAYNSLGFEWNAKQPDTVVITVGVYGIANVDGVEFNADGDIISGLQPATRLTDYSSNSTSTFIMTFEQFQEIAEAKAVKMKLDGDTSASVSSFGSSTGALVNTKFQGFITAVDQYRGS